jgi:putative ABC transport system ATP-binding protein
MTEDPLLRLESVRKIHVTDDVETHALQETTLSVMGGEFISVSGPSGCGKSTLLSLMGLLDTPTSGTLFIRGAPVSDLDRESRARVRNREIGFIFQAFNLIGDLTVRENVELPLTYRGMSSRERRRRAEHALEQVSMSHRSNHLPSQLSGGQQQRVAVGRALAGHPAVLLADEPTGNLDSENGRQVMRLLEELHASGATIVVVTHDSHYASYASREIRMIDGRVLVAESVPAPERVQ